LGGFVLSSPASNTPPSHHLEPRRTQTRRIASAEARVRQVLAGVDYRTRHTQAARIGDAGVLGADGAVGEDGARLALHCSLNGGVGSGGARATGDVASGSRVGANEAERACRKANARAIFPRIAIGTRRDQRTPCVGVVFPRATAVAGGVSAGRGAVFSGGAAHAVGRGSGQAVFPRIALGTRKVAGAALVDIIRPCRTRLAGAFGVCTNSGAVLSHPAWGARRQTGGGGIRACGTGRAL
jgi:hypothetical protein